MRTHVTHERLTDWFQSFRHWRSRLRKLWYLSESDLDDVAQEVFLRLLRYDNVELIEHPQAYLFRMAVNVAGEWSMRSRHRHPHDARWLDDLQSESDPERELTRENTHKQLRQALANLPPRQREVLRLHFGEGLARAEIAERLETSARSVKRDLINAYARLRIVLDPDLAGRAELRDWVGNEFRRG
jgi:RNA polymerase sigma-70 factor (ECF subfamily)